MERLPFPIRLCSAVAMLLFLMLFVASRWSLHLSSDASGEIPFMQKPALIHTLGSWLDGAETDNKQLYRDTWDYELETLRRTYPEESSLAVGSWVTPGPGVDASSVGRLSDRDRKMLRDEARMRYRDDWTLAPEDIRLESQRTYEDLGVLR